MSNRLGRHKNRYIQALVLIGFNWEQKFLVHTNTFQLTIGAILAHNAINKFAAISYVFF
jgi:hypothetical protein